MFLGRTSCVFMYMYIYESNKIDCFYVFKEIITTYIVNFISIGYLD